jgi:hypothetical protein
MAERMHLVEVLQDANDIKHQGPHTPADTGSPI